MQVEFQHNLGACGLSLGTCTKVNVLTVSHIDLSVPTNVPLGMVWYCFNFMQAKLYTLGRELAQLNNKNFRNHPITLNPTFIQDTLGNVYFTFCFSELYVGLLYYITT